MIAWWQVALLIAVLGVFMLAATKMGADIADKARMRAVLDDRAKWEAPRE